MRNHNSPFLSAAAIRRILAVHPFSEENRVYLLEEATRRESWECEVKSLLDSIPSLTEPPAPRPIVEVDPSLGRPLHATPPH